MFVHTYMTSHTCTTGVYHQVLTRGWSAMQSSIFDYCTTPRRYTRIYALQVVLTLYYVPHRD